MILISEYHNFPHSTQEGAASIMAKTFYPFVDGDESPLDPEGLSNPSSSARIAVYDSMTMAPRVEIIEPTDIRTYLDEITKTVFELASGLSNPSSSARIAVYDSMTMAPRVEIIEPTDIRTYLDEITKTVFELASQQGGDWSFMLIRELVENFIHASFIEPSISILDKGQTLVFSDQGPGIPNKPAALKPSFSSATKAMKRYIRGVGSGLPIVEEQLKMRNGTLTIEDNLGHGTIVTVSLVPGREGGSEVQRSATAQAAPNQTIPPSAYPTPGGMPPQAYGVQPPAQPYASAPYPMGYPAQGTGMPYGMQPQQSYGYPPAYGYQQPYQPPQGGMPTQGQPGYNPYYPPTSQQQAYQPYGMAPTYGMPPTGSYGSQAPNVQPPTAPPVYPAPTEGGMDAFAPAKPPEQSKPVAASKGATVAAHVCLDEQQQDIMRLFTRIEHVGGAELIKELGLTPSTASRRLKSLAKAGHIMKEEGKQKYVLTGEGELVLAQLTNNEG